MAVNRMVRWFEFEHLPPELQAASAPFAELAHLIDELPESAEKTAGLRKLLEAKDCVVRATLEARQAAAGHG